MLKGMSMLRFEWNENKNTLNKKKHGISFEEATTGEEKRYVKGI